MKRYIVAVASLTTDDEKSFIKFIREKKFGWWHRIANLWLLIDNSEISDAAEIRNFVLGLDSAKIGLVLENPSQTTWAGFSEEDKLKESFAWIEKNWDL
jgi:hypothetical protein